ncbi:hypothetical protein ACKVWC_011555 [Pyricularia oryzae]
MYIKPRILAPCKLLYPASIWHCVHQPSYACDHLAQRIGYTVNVIVLLPCHLLPHLVHRVTNTTRQVILELDVRLGLDEPQLHERHDPERPKRRRGTPEQIRPLPGPRRPRDLPRGQDDLDPLHRRIECAMPKRAALARRARETPAGGDAGELHDDGRDEAVRRGGGDQGVHGHVGLDHGDPALRVHGQHVVQPARVDRVVGPLVRPPRAVGRAVVDAERLPRVREVLHARRDGRHCCVVCFHCLCSVVDGRGCSGVVSDSSEKSGLTPRGKKGAILCEIGRRPESYGLANERTKQHPDE